MGFLSFALAIWTAMHAYVAWRLTSLTPFTTHGRAVTLAAVVLGSSYLGGRIIEALGWTATARPLELVGALWMGTLFLTVMCLLCADLVTGFGLWLTAWIPTIRVVAFASAALLASVAVMLGYAAPVVNTFEVDIAGLPAERDGTSLVFVSDLHLGPLFSSSWVNRRVDVINALRADLIIAGGDIFDGQGSAQSEHAAVLRRLAAPLGVFAVTGNHDGHRGLQARVDLHRATGFRFLHNEWVQLAPGLVIAGVDDLSFAPAPAREANIRNTLGSLPPGAATIYVSHGPVGAETAARLGAGLMLSGHTHGGQIWPFSLAVGAVYPLLAGRYDVAGMPVIVSRGMGMFGPRMRLWHRSDIVRVVLHSASRRTGPHQP